VCGVAGILLCWLGFANEFLLYAGAFIFGAFYATAVVLVPIVVRQSFGTRDYSVIYSRVSTVFNLLAAFASMIWAAISSAFGFNVLFIVGLVFLVIIILLGFYTFANAKKHMGEWTD
jgi:cyanate permease